MWWNKKSVNEKNGTAAKAMPALKKTALMMSLEPRFMFDGAVAAVHARAVFAESHLILP